MRRIRSLALVLSLIFIASCGMLQVSDTPIENYGEALGAWTDIGTQFKFYYERADTETKARWDKEFRPMLIKAKDVLNLWKMHLDVGGSTSGDLTQWKPLKNELIYYLATQMK